MKKFKKIIAMCLAAVMAMSVMSIGAFAADPETVTPYVHYGSKPTSLAAIPFDDEMNGVNSDTGMGYSDFYFNCGNDQRVILDMSDVNVITSDAGASVKMIIKNWNNDDVIATYNFTTNSQGRIPSNNALRTIYFAAPTNFYIQIETTPRTVHFYGNYRLTN